MLKNIGSNIRASRLKKRLTQEQLSEMALINSKYLGEIERGEKTPSAIVIYRLSQSLNVSICRILSFNKCRCIDKERINNIEKLLSGKNKKDVDKAIKILEVFFG